MCVLFSFSFSLATSEKSSDWICSLKKVFLKVLQNWQENTCVGAGLKLYQERESGTGIFLWFLWSFLRTPFFIEYFWAPVLSLLLESPIFWGFLSSNLPDVYLWVFWFTLHMLLFYLSSNSDHTKSFNSHKVCTLCLFSFPNQWNDVRRRKNVKTQVNVLPMV